VKRTPRITVLVSSYRNARFVARKLDEIRCQTSFEHAEFLFIETGSPERERELFAPFCRQNTNCRIIATDDRKTLYQAWNLGWREAAAPIVCYSNMDDAMHPRLLEEVVGAMESRLAGACTALIAKQPMDEQWNDWTPARIARLPLSTRFGAFVAWRTALRAEIGEFDERFAAAGDKEFWHRLSQNTSVYLIPKILYLYTRNPASLSREVRGDERWQKEQALLRSLGVKWPANLKTKVRLARLRRLVQPSFGIVPLESR
jgi:GT2 family glycosyltransferase